jgi:hypothetical protein
MTHITRDQIAASRKWADKAGGPFVIIRGRPDRPGRSAEPSADDRPIALRLPAHVRERLENRCNSRPRETPKSSLIGRLKEFLRFVRPPTVNH